VLVVMAHPDDAELWAGGTLALHAQTAHVSIAIPPSDPARLAEAAAGADILGANLHLLEGAATPQSLSALMIQLRPDVVITHPTSDVHPDHRSLAATVLAALPDAVITAGFPRRLYTCDTYNSLTLDGPLAATTVIDITETYPTKMRALAAHNTTQPITDHFGPMAENLARLWGARIGTPYAEPFTAVPILGRLPGAAHL
jgi:LmbE family N-acetylglucosaminyl deacetylase